MVRKLFQYLLLALVMLLVFLASALLAMRFAIHGREVRVPKLAGLTPVQAERLANDEGLVFSIGGRFYSQDVPAGRIISQAPAAGVTVRRGWKIVASESLGRQRAAVPDLLGQSYHAAAINLGHRGLEIGNVATVHLPGAAPQVVVAQNPRPESNDVSSPRVDLVLSAPDNGQQFVMPNFVGQSLTKAAKDVQSAGFELGKLPAEAYTSEGHLLSIPIARQYPAAGEKVTRGTRIYFAIKKGAEKNSSQQ